MATVGQLGQIVQSHPAIPFFVTLVVCMFTQSSDYKEIGKHRGRRMHILVHLWALTSELGHNSGGLRMAPDPSRGLAVLVD